jgi:uncharacterized protein YraI
MSRISIILFCAFLSLATLASISTPEPASAAYVKLAYDASLQEIPQDAGYSLTMLPAGVVVTITGDPVDGYYPVTAGGQAGWVRGDALAFDAVVGQAPAESADANLAPEPVVQEMPVVEGPAPDAALAEEPAPVELVAEEPDPVDVPVEDPALTDPAMAAPMAATPVVDAALTGPAPAAVGGEMAPADQPPLAPVEAAPVAESVAPAVNLDPNAPTVAVPDPGPVGPAAVAAEAPILAGPGPDYGVLGVASPGALVEQTGHAVGGYVTVRYVGVTGWVSLDLLAPPPGATSG